jgi:hypothetical protein
VQEHRRGERTGQGEKLKNAANLSENRSQDTAKLGKVVDGSFKCKLAKGVRALGWKDRSVSMSNWPPQAEGDGIVGRASKQPWNKPESVC